MFDSWCYPKSEIKSASAGYADGRLECYTILSTPFYFSTLLAEPLDAARDLSPATLSEAKFCAVTKNNSPSPAQDGQTASLRSKHEQNAVDTRTVRTRQGARGQFRVPGLERRTQPHKTRSAYSRVSQLVATAPLQVAAAGVCFY